MLIVKYKHNLLKIQEMHNQHNHNNQKQKKKKLNNQKLRLLNQFV